MSFSSDSGGSAPSTLTRHRSRTLVLLFLIFALACDRRAYYDLLVLPNDSRPNRRDLAVAESRRALEEIGFGCSHLQTAGDGKPLDLLQCRSSPRAGATKVEAAFTEDLFGFRISSIDGRIFGPPPADEAKTVLQDRLTGTFPKSSRELIDPTLADGYDSIEDLVRSNGASLAR